MSKLPILKSLLQQLASTLADIIHTAHVAREAATNEESRPENEYDTRALEASYLAGAQAKRSEELKAAIDKLSVIKLREFHDEDEVALTALVKVLVNGDKEKTFFLLPGAGGSKVVMDDREINIITPESTVGDALMGKTTGDGFELAINARVFDYEIIGIS